jgi:hypothetical protein
MSIKRLLACLALIALGGLGGAVAGYDFGQCDLVDSDRPLDLFAATQARYAAYAFSLGKGRSDESQEAVLHAYLNYLDERSQQAGPANRSLYGFDKAVVLTRLSEIARRRVAGAEAEQLSKAVDEVCTTTGIRKCTGNSLLGTVRERDRQIWAGVKK